MLSCDQAHAVVEGESEVVILGCLPMEGIVVVDPASIKDASSRGIEDVEVDVVVCT